MSKKQFLNNISIQKKILITLILTIVGLLSIWVINFIVQQITANYQDEMNKSIKLKSNISLVQIGFLNARRSEKDFQMRLHQKYIDKHAQTVEMIHIDINHTANFATGNAIKQINDLRNIFSGYVKEFTEISNIGKKIGATQDDGLRGELRKAVANVENLLAKHEKMNAKNIGIKEVIISMLSLRRAEKDFIIRSDIKYLNKFNKEMGKFISLTNNSNIAKLDKDRIINFASIYKAAFSKLVSITIKINTNFLNLSKKYAQALPILSSLAEMADTKNSLAVDNISKIQSQVQIFGAMAIITIFLIVVVSSIIVGRNITGAVVSLNNDMTRISRGEKDVAITRRIGSDEIAVMSNTLTIFQRNMTESTRLQEEASLMQEKELERGRKIDDLTTNFSAKITNVLEIVSSASTELDASSQTMSGIASGSSERATAAAAASNEATTNVQTVSAACEELSASIQEISRQAVQSNELAQLASSDVEKTESVVNELSESAKRISEIVSIISDIAEQTNLLALNATIEAARAGDAGKGFAVVANEVKSLATQTGRATNEIGETINFVLEKVSQSVDAIHSVTGRISEITAMISSIASSVDEQNAATSEISRNVEEAAKGTSEVNRNVSDVSSMAEEAGMASSEVQSAAAELATQSNTMKIVVDNFLTGVKSA